MNSVKLEIVTPSKLFYRGEVDLVIVTTLEGDEGFMAGHCWGCKLLDIGELWIQEKGAEKNEWRVAAVAGDHAGDQRLDLRGNVHDHFRAIQVHAYDRMA